MRIRLGYDAIKDMDLKSDIEESNEKRPDGYSHMIIHKYEVSLSSFKGRLDSPFESPTKDSTTSIITGGRKGEVRRNPANASAREIGNLAIITQEKEHTKTIMRVYFNGKEA